MSAVDCGFPDQPGFLEHRGPILMVRIDFNPDFPTGMPVHPSESRELLPALVDTGAATTCIDAKLAMTLNLPVINQRTVAGVHGEGIVNIHSAQIYVPALTVAFSGAFVGAHLIAGGQPYYALIGRDFLRHFHLSYDGRTGAVTLSND